MLIVDGMPELSLLQSLLTSSIISLFPLSILDTKLSEEHVIFACDTMSVSLLMSLFLSFLGRFRISFLTPLFPGN